MPSLIDTTFGPFFSPQDNISIKEVGGRDCGERLKLVLFNTQTQEKIACLDIQSDASKERVTNFLTRNGFEKTPRAEIGKKIFAAPDLTTHFRTTFSDNHLNAQIVRETEAGDEMLDSVQLVSSRPVESQLAALTEMVQKHGFKEVELAPRLAA